MVFVHGFGGRCTHSWSTFADHSAPSTWWWESDLLFVGYRSMRDGVVGVADRLRRELPSFVPRPPDGLLGTGPKGRDREPYEEVILVGHSLGGLIVRRAVADSTQEWINRGRPEHDRPALMDAKVRLFSPASAGFQPNGWLSLFTDGRTDLVARLTRAMATTFMELQPDSKVLVCTRRRTEALALESSAPSALRAHLVWANPDRVVITERYDTDAYSDSIDGVSHRGVCKPVPGFIAPRTFVEIGSVPRER
ncbi:MAG: hypothetical protein ITG02_02740 [Patulibacter sp.]|nr:hypothetical protein [Patulibacter sp.]